MTPEELLIPRYKVIADWPGIEDMGWYVGQILDITHHHNGKDNIAFLDKYPHLFQRLPWYAERKEEDMPEYVKIVSGHFASDYGIVGKAQYGLGNKTNVTIWHPGGASHRPIKDTIPATADEYINQRKRK